MKSQTDEKDKQCEQKNKADINPFTKEKIYVCIGKRIQNKTKNATDTKKATETGNKKNEQVNAANVIVYWPEPKMAGPVVIRKKNQTLTNSVNSLPTK